MSVICFCVVLWGVFRCLCFFVLSCGRCRFCSPGFPLFFARCCFFVLGEAPYCLHPSPAPCPSPAPLKLAAILVRTTFALAISCPLSGSLAPWQQTSGTRGARRGASRTQIHARGGTMTGRRGTTHPTAHKQPLGGLIHRPGSTTHRPQSRLQVSRGTLHRAQ